MVLESKDFQMTDTVLVNLIKEVWKDLENCIMMKIFERTKKPNSKINLSQKKLLISFNIKVSFKMKCLKDLENSLILTEKYHLVIILILIKMVFASTII